MSTERRRLRSRRALVSVGLLASASLVVTSAVLLAGTSVLVLAAVYAVVAGVVAARLLSNEVAHTRREWSRDRAEQAKAYQRIMSDRTRDQAEFAHHMTDRLSRRDADLLEMRGTLRVAEATTREVGVRLDAERDRYSTLRAEHDDLRTRHDELAGTVHELQAEQEQVADALAVWDGADVPTIVDLLNWEQAATAASTHAADPQGETRGA